MPEPQLQNFFSQCVLRHQKSGGEKVEKQMAKFCQASLAYGKVFPNPISLYGGLVGYLWLHQYIYGKKGQRSKVYKQTKKEVVGQVNSIKAKEVPYDLVDGWVGTGIFFLSEGPRKNKNNLEKIIKKIISYKTTTSIGEHYLTIKPGGPRIDLGLAHGLSGLLLFFSLCYKYKIEPKTCRREAENIVLLMNRIYKINGRAMPSYFPINEDSLNRRVAWCYGDLSYGFALTAAGRRFARQSWIKEGKAIFYTSAKKYISESNTPYLCHGSAGIVQMCSRMRELVPGRLAEETLSIWKGQLNRQLADLAAQKSEKELPGWPYDQSGVELVLNSKNIKTRKWDSYLLLSDPFKGTAI